jgi:DNA-binding FadR family transcriptional regulator
MEPQPTERKLTQITVDRIKEYIVRNKLKPGDRLPTERSLAEQLAVSRPVVREALSHLVTLGLVDKRQGQGLFIKQQNMSRLFQEMMLITHDDREKMHQLLEFRAMLEQAAILKLSGRIGEDDRNVLLDIIDQAERAESDKDFTHQDLAFHRKLVKLADNPYLLELVTVIDNYFALIEDTSLTAEAKRTTLDVHRRLVAMLAEGDRYGALELMHRHLLAAKANGAAIS